MSSLALEVISTGSGPERAEQLTAGAVQLARSTGKVVLLGEALLTRAPALDVAGGRQALLAVVDEAAALRRRDPRQHVGPGQGPRRSPGPARRDRRGPGALRLVDLTRRSAALRSQARQATTSAQEVVREPGGLASDG